MDNSPFYLQHNSLALFFFSSRRRHTISLRDWSSDVCSSDLQGSVANLVDYAVLPLTCPADGWRTLNAGARAQSDHTNAACGAFPADDAAGSGATVPGLPALETYNHRFHNNPDWGLLARASGGCATAVGP